MQPPVHINKCSHVDTNIIMQTWKNGVLLLLYYYVYTGTQNIPAFQITYDSNDSIRHKRKKIRCFYHTQMRLDPIAMSQMTQKPNSYIPKCSTKTSEILIPIVVMQCGNLCTDEWNCLIVFYNCIYNRLYKFIPGHKQRHKKGQIHPLTIGY